LAESVSYFVVIGTSLALACAMLAGVIRASISEIRTDPMRFEPSWTPHDSNHFEQLPHRGPERENGSEAGYLLNGSKREPAFPAQIEG